MGYSTNPRTLDQIRPLLDNLEKGLSCTWEVSAGSENKWAYKVREALYIARLYKDRYPALAQAADAFKIEIAQRGVVRAVPAGNTLEPRVLSSGGPVTVNHGIDGDTPGLAHKTRSVSLTGPQSAESILHAWFMTQPSNQPLYFPDAALDHNELIKLHGLASDQNLIFFESEGAITLQHRTADLVEFAWDPTLLESPEEPIEGQVDLSFLRDS